MSRLSKRAYVLQNLESLIAWHTAQLITANKQFDEAQQFYIFTASKTGKGSSTAFFKLKMMDNKARQVQQLMFWRQIWSWSGLPKTARLEKRPLKRSLKLWIWAPASTELLSCPSPKHPHLSKFEWVRCITCAITQIYSNALKRYLSTPIGSCYNYSIVPMTWHSPAADNRSLALALSRSELTNSLSLVHTPNPYLWHANPLFLPAVEATWSPETPG